MIRLQAFRSIQRQILGHVFPSNCNAGSGDQIDFIMKMEGGTKHEAIMKAKHLLGYRIIKEIKAKSTTDYKKLFQQLKRNFKSGQAVKYLELRNLDRKKVEIGYNADIGTLQRYF